MSIESKILDLNKNQPEIALLSELSYEISNFKKGFKGKMKHTFILSPWASSLFGIEIYDSKAYIGVPEPIFNILSKTRLYLINYMKDKPGIFIVFDMGGEGKKRPAALRIHVRSERVKALSKFKKLTLIKMSSNGIAEPGFDVDEFTLGIRRVRALDWENFSQ